MTNLAGGGPTARSILRDGVGQSFRDPDGDGQEAVANAEITQEKWSRTPTLFIHDEKHHEYRTPRVLAIQGKEHVLVNGVRIMFPGKPDHLDDRMKPGPVSAFPGRLVRVQVSIGYGTPEEGRHFPSLFQKGNL